MSVQNGERLATKQDLADMYQGILPYLGGMPEVLANKFSKGDLYSTEEKMIGQWIDGKPLYQKTMTTTVTAKNTNVYFDDTPTNIDKIVDLVGRIYISDSDQSMFNKFISDGEFINYYANKVYVYVIYDNKVGKPAVGTVIYTKTTDTAISIGSDTDYSTEEKIVGTWIDSKPVWQKTVVLDNVVYDWSTKNSYGISDIDMLIGVNNVRVNYNDGSSNWWTGLFWESTTSYLQALFDKNNFRIVMLPQSKRQYLGRLIMTLQYTKTT